MFEPIVAHLLLVLIFLMGWHFASFTNMGS
jgi:hypothetical protein